MLSGVPAVAETPSTDVALTGNWSGESICVVRESACRDERVVYHFGSADSSGKVSLQADKIVDGRAIDMGSSLVTYDRVKKTISWSLPNGGAWLFHVNGAAMQGTLTLPPAVLFRNVNLRKDP
jgi:hypothetical protein